MNPRARHSIPIASRSFASRPQRPSGPDGASGLNFDE